MSKLDNDINWFLAQLKPNSHSIAERNLARQGFGTFLPMQEETRRTNGKFITRMRPLFPGYIFVALDPARGGWRAVNSTTGITRLVCLGTEPTPVPGGSVSELMRRCDLDGKLLPPQDIGTGDRVVMSGGPFADFVATIQSVSPDRRVHVLIELMGAQTRVASKAKHLRPR